VRGRHVTTGITLVALCGLLVAGVVVGAKFLFAKAPSPTQLIGSPSASPTCTAQLLRAGSRLRSAKVRVSVYNAGSRSGLAQQTMTALKHRGFKSGDVGNAPSGVHVRRVEVWTTQPHDAAARLVARQFGRHVRATVTKTDLGSGVDVVLGNHYNGLVPAPRWVKVRHSEQVCARSGVAAPTG